MSRRQFVGYFSEESATDSHIPIPPSPRERQVLELIALGFRNEEIGEHLHVSLETVKSHVRHVLSKFGARSRAQAIVIGLQRGWLELPPLESDS